MTYYECITEELQRLIDNGTITLEFAEEVNQLAYNKYEESTAATRRDYVPVDSLGKRKFVKNTKDNLYGVKQNDINTLHIGKEVSDELNKSKNAKSEMEKKLHLTRANIAMNKGKKTLTSEMRKHNNTVITK